MAFIDIYTVGYSPRFDVVKREELTENLELTPNPVVNSGILKGTVSYDGIGIKGATVKVYDTNNKPIEHTDTGGNGQYTIANLPTGSYKATAIADGYLLPIPISFTIQSNKTTTTDISLSIDPAADLSFIYGIIRSSIGDTLLENATVSLYSDTQPDPTLIITVSTNDKGQYIFGLIPPGDYYVEASKLGYFPSQTSIINVGTRELIDSDITLLSNPLTNTGTVSGFIKDVATDLPIADAGVALYSIVNGTEKIVDITRTNATGMYLFPNVNPGTYLVKSTKQQETNQI